MSNSSQGGRSARTTKPDLWYYDQLPPTARKALAEAAFNWSSGAMLNRWKRGARGYKTGAQIAERVKAADAAVIAKSIYR